jgi:exonuclease III
MYKALSGEVNEFLRRLDATLKYLYNPKSEFIICGEININYLNESSQKKQVKSLLRTYNLSHTVNFATRVQKSSRTAIDNIFIDRSRLSSPCTLLCNWLSMLTPNIPDDNTLRR